MLPFTLTLTAIAVINKLTYLVKTQASGWSTIGIVLLAIIICGNILTTVMPNIICVLWSIERAKVSAHSYGLWFCLTVGIICGIAG